MPKKDDYYKVAKNIALMSELAFTIMGPIVGGILLGRWLDAKYLTGNLWLIILTIVGVVSGFGSFLRLALKSAGKGGKK